MNTLFEVNGGLLLKVLRPHVSTLAKDTGDNGVHASASPFEALAERSNWLRASISKDPFGKALLASGIPLNLLTKEWLLGTIEPVLKVQLQYSYV